jgi:hypothetical protein
MARPHHGAACPPRPPRRRRLGPRGGLGLPPRATPLPTGRGGEGRASAAWAGAPASARANTASNHMGSGEWTWPAAHCRRSTCGSPKPPPGWPAVRMCCALQRAPGSGQRRLNAARTWAQLPKGGAGPLCSPGATPSAATVLRRGQQVARAAPQASHSAQQLGPWRRSASPKAGARCSEVTKGQPARRRSPRNTSIAPRRLAQVSGSATHRPTGSRIPKVSGGLGAVEPLSAVWGLAGAFDALQSGKDPCIYGKKEGWR